MKVNIRKTYLLKFENLEDYIQFSIECKKKIFSKVIFSPVRYEESFCYICKITVKSDNLIPIIKEFCNLKQISPLEEAYLKEYGKL